MITKYLFAVASYKNIFGGVDPRYLSESDSDFQESLKKIRLEKLPQYNIEVGMDDWLWGYNKTYIYDNGVGFETFIKDLIREYDSVIIHPEDMDETGLMTVIIYNGYIE